MRQTLTVHSLHCIILSPLTVITDRFQLISFNDYGREINRNVQLEVGTNQNTISLTSHGAT